MRITTAWDGRRPQRTTSCLALLFVAHCWIAMPSGAGAQDCAGDCDGRGTVTRDELLTGMHIALGGASLNGCNLADGNQNGEVTVDDLLAAVNSTFSGCPIAATPTPTPTQTGTTVPTPTNTSDVPTPPLIGHILFQSSRNDNVHIFEMDPDGANVVELTHGTVSDRAPQWNSDRSRIVFTREGLLHVMDGDGSNITKLRTAGTQFSPTFSRDGSVVVYVELTNSGSNLYSYTFATGDIRRLSNGSWSDANPTFAPDGQLMFFTSNRDDLLFEIYRMDPDGSNVVRVTNNQRFDALGQVSPDGTRVIIAGREKVGTISFGISVMDIDGSNLAPLTSTADDSDDESPIWSPDGNYIVYRAFINGRPKIYRMQSDGQFPTDLSRNNAFEFAGDWK